MPRPSRTPSERPEEQFRDFWRACGLPESGRAPAEELIERQWALIQTHNAAAGLMGKTSRAEFYLKHVCDSLAVLLVYPELLRGPTRLADVGCGAGLPGMILAAALPELHLTAIESTRKKSAFLALAVEALGLADRAEVRPYRSRELGHDERFRRGFDVVTARAAGSCEKLIRDCRLLIAPGGSAIFYKTPRVVSAETPPARREARKHKLVLEVSRVIELPGGAGTRQFLRVVAP